MTLGTDQTNPQQGQDGADPMMSDSTADVKQSDANCMMAAHQEWHPIHDFFEIHGLHQYYPSRQ